MKTETPISCCIDKNGNYIWHKGREIKTMSLKKLIKRIDKKQNDYYEWCKDHDMSHGEYSDELEKRSELVYVPIGTEILITWIPAIVGKTAKKSKMKWWPDTGGEGAGQVELGRGKWTFYVHVEKETNKFYIDIMMGM